MSQAVPTVVADPILGSLGDFARRRIDLLTRIPAQYGDVARMKLGLFASALVVSSPELAHETLVAKSDAFVKSRGLSIFAKPVLGNGLITSEGQVHRRNRRMIAPAFGHKRLAEYARTMASYAERSVEKLGRVNETDLSQEMMQLTFEIVGKTLFNADVSADASAVGEAVTDAMQQLTRQVSSIVPLPPAVPSPRNLRARRMVRRLDDVVYRMIRDRRASCEDEGDLLSMLLTARDEDDGGGFSDQQVRDEAMTILLAGHETMATALAWTFYMLGKHPAARDRLEAEVDRVLVGRSPSFEDLPRLPYTLQVLKETMRLYPPVYMVLRRATRDLSLGVVDVRKDEIVLVDVIGMHRRPAYFPDPLRFDPERFAPEGEKTMVRYSYLPFGGGPRMCIGNHFALMEGQIVLAHLARHLRFDLIQGREEIGYLPLITLRPRGGVPVRVQRRPCGPTRAEPLAAAE